MIESEVEPQLSTRVGLLLKNRRLQAGLDTRDVSQILRIREVYIEAIEAGHFQALPTPVCALGFVRSYAELLQLDAEEIVRRYKQENADFPASAVSAWAVEAIRNADRNRALTGMGIGLE